MVTLQEADGDPLLLSPVEGIRTVRQTSSHHHHIPSDATLTYASLDVGGNIVLQPLKTEPHSQVSQTGVTGDRSKRRDNHSADEMGATQRNGNGPQLVVVGEAGGGDAMTYIYIQSEADTKDDGQMEARDAHTITLNSADGSTLHTLPASYTQHLEHTYGDLVLVGSGNDGSGDVGDGETVSTTIGEVTATNDGSQEDEQVLLLSVGPLKLDDENGRHTLSMPSTRQGTTQPPRTQISSVTVGEVITGGRGRREGIRHDEKFPDDETSTIEARLATRDSLLPPRRNRRCGDPGKLTCPVCHTQFKSGRQYHGHLHVHRGQGVWHCDICEYTCDSAVELRVHKSEMHQDARPFKCPNCHLSFPKSLMLEDHVRSVHNKERPFTCSFCTKGFYRPHDLKMHLNVHLGIKSNVCHVCGRQFSHPSNLIRHQRLHTGIKPYVCATCGKRFTQVTLLHKHRTTHQPGAGVCPLCPSTFRSVAGLRKHSKIEHKKPMTLQEAARIIRGQRGAAGRSYYCRVCGAQFSVKSELKVHEQQEHGKSTEHRCASCNKVFSTAEVKTHTCLTAEEEEKRNRLYSPQHVITPETTATAINSTTTVKSLDEDTRSQEEAVEEEEEEEYLVMYITPEGESVSYVMKKGSKASRDEILQVNAPRTDQLNEDSLPRPTLSEETIMINVQDRPILTHHRDEQTIVLAPQVGEATLAAQDKVIPTTNFSNLVTNNPDSSLPVHSIKLEPQPNDDLPSDSIDASQIPDKSLLPLVTLNTPSSPKILKKQGMHPVSMKRNAKDFAVKNENYESGIESKSEVTRTHTPSPLVCKDCGKTFQKQWNFQQHIATHDASLHRYKCGMCSLTFAYRSTLNKHMEKHRPTQETYECKQCSKTYKCQTSLKQHHKREHMHQRPYACDLCGKDFFSKSDFRYHMRVHKKEQPYMCFACGREFSHVSHLHRHERVHTGERPHKCPLCTKKFIQSVTLKIHLKKHEKKGPEEMVTLANDTRYSSGNVGISLAVGSDMMSNNITTVANTSQSMCSGDEAALNTNKNVEEPLSINNDTDMRLASAVVNTAVVASSSNTLVNSAGGASALTENQLPPGTIIFAQGDLNGANGGGQFSGGHAAVVTGMDGDCIAIFVQESLD